MKRSLKILTVFMIFVLLFSGCNNAVIIEEPTDPMEKAEAILSQMSLREKVYQMFMICPEQLTDDGNAVLVANEEYLEKLKDYPVGGFIMFGKNLESREQILALNDALKSACKITPFIAVDEEGGSVARLGYRADKMHVTTFTDMGQIKTEDEAYLVGYTIGSEIQELGFNLDFAPVSDVNSNPNNPVIGERAFSSDPIITARMVSSCVKGFKESGVLCTLKHFPGHGDTDSDTHLGEAVTYKTLEELEECEFLPFKAGINAGADCVMVAHILTPNVTSDGLPASLSKEIVTGLLREELGFKGIVVTDALNMRAITDYYSTKEVAEIAIAAGVDLLLLSEDFISAADGIIEDVEKGIISKERVNESVLKILAIKENL